MSQLKRLWYLPDTGNLGNWGVTRVRCVCVGGGGGGNFGMGVRASILKPTTVIYLAFEKNSQFIYLISQKVDLLIYCPLNILN